MKISFIGSAGIPNRYGGFEAFLEHCGPAMAALGVDVQVTCDSRLYINDRSPKFNNVNRIFIDIPANGAASIFHDLVAFLKVYRQSDRIVVLGVSGGIWFPFFRICCAWAGKRLTVNVDGVEWRRKKFNPLQRRVLRLFDVFAQWSAHVVIYDNEALSAFLSKNVLRKAVQIGYSGDQALRLPNVEQDPGTALTVCRIEPENNIDLLIEGALQSSLNRYIIVGNWSTNSYGRALRQRYAHESRLELLDAIYEPIKLAQLREKCGIYLHGHSVGGTNPSLVEMLYYDCALLCLDVTYNRHTVGDAARYFSTTSELVKTINLIVSQKDAGRDANKRQLMRERYTREAIANAYLSASA